MKKFGLLGKSLKHSFSPVIHEVIGNTIDSNHTYDLIERNEADIEQLFEEFAWDGINITIPYKKTVMAFCDEISLEAQEIGAVNTIHKVNGRFLAYNTDYTGITRALEIQGVSVKNERVIILGNGGASQAAIVYALNHNAKEVCVVSRNPLKSEHKGAQLINYQQLDEIKEGYLLINATPVGMYPKMDACPINEDIVARYAHVFDMIYNPAETKLLKKAKDTATTCQNGLSMLVCQAIRAQEIWQNKNILSQECEQIITIIIKEIGHA